MGNQPYFSTLISIFDQSANQFAEAVAVRGNGFSYSYQQFKNASIHFALQLSEYDSARGQMIGICLERSAEMVVGIFGILRFGGAYVPTDPSNPPQRIISIYKDAGVRYVVTTADLVDFVQSLGFIPIVPILTISEPPTSNFPDIQPLDNAYVLFTSGSTGTPKGVMVGHGSVVNLIQYVQNRYPISAGDVVLLKSPYTFDGSIWELFGWMMMGASLYVADPGAEKSPIELTRILDQQGITFLFFVPSMLGAFLDYYSTQKNTTFRSLKWVSVGGEVLPVSMVSRFYSLFDENRVGLINVYGPTETTVYATTYLCNSQDKNTKIPIGEAVTNDLIYILDENLQPVLPGEEGEICIGGVGVANGYLNRPELTAEKFVPDTILGAGTMYYRTGDVGKQLENGLFDFVGRRDFQVKMRGLRIEIGEIEFALQQLKELKESIVVFAKDRNGDDCLVAYVVANLPLKESVSEGFTMATAAFSQVIQQQLSEFLPQYMIPTEIVLCSAFPLTANGKIDRKALIPISELVDYELIAGFDPQTEIAQKVYEIWQTVLDRQLIGGDELFFAAGGHSLKAVQVITAVIRAFGREIPLIEFYKDMTLRKMSTLLEQSSYDEFDELLEAEISNPERMVFPLTPAQSELWVMNDLDATGLIHNIQVEFVWKGVVDIDRFIACVEQTVKAEETFRSVFPLSEGVPVQQILDDVVFEIPFFDLSRVNDPEKATIYAKTVEQNGNVKFDLTRLPLFSFRLIKWESDEYRLLFAIHHLIFDGWSLHLFMNRIEQRYQGITPQLSQYRNGDYAIWLNKYLSSGRVDGVIDYWKQTLDGIPTRLTLPTKPNAQLDEAGRYGRRYWWEIASTTTLAVEQLAVSYSVTPFVVMMSAYQLVLGAAAGQADVVVGTPYANRKFPMVADLVGYFTNMVSIRSTLEEGDSFASFVSRCSDNAMGAFSNAVVPFGLIAKTIRQGFKVGSNPIFQAIFVMQNWPHENNLHPEYTFTQREIGNDTCKMDMMLNVEKCDDSFVCWLEYDTVLFDESFACRLSEGINRVLEAMVASPERKIADIKNQLALSLKPAPRFSCIVIGEGSIPMACIALLEQFNIRVDFIVSDDQLLKDLAEKLAIPICRNLKDISAFHSVDYIFSINNGLILCPQFMALAKHLVINYHDSALPRYAGMHATNHAILHHEKAHAISWHVVVDEIDAGDILISENVQISLHETAQTLNYRCFETAVRSFSRLLQSIVDENVVLTPQNMGNRSYFGLANRPQTMGFLCWNEGVQHLNAMLRACNFGQKNDNEFLMPAMLIDERIYFISKARVEKGVFGSIGEVVKVKEALAVACEGGCVVLIGLYDSAGFEIDVVSVIRVGQILSVPNASFLAHIHSKFTQIAKHENYWKKQFTKSDFLPSPVISFSSESTISDQISLSNGLLEELTIKFPAHTKADILCAIASLFALRLSRKTEGTVGLVSSGLSALNTECLGYFGQWLPFNIRFEADDTLEDSLGKLLKSVTLLVHHNNYCSNLRLRYPALLASATTKPSVFVVTDGEDMPYEAHSSLVFELSDQSICLRGATPVIAEALRLLIAEFSQNSPQKTVAIPLFMPESGLVSFERINVAACEIQPFDDVVDQFWKKAKLLPVKKAIVDQDKTISYQKFTMDICELSSFLSKQGVTTGSRVAINIDRSYSYFVLMMATLHCGAAFVPVMPSLPLERQRFMVEDSGAMLVFGRGNDDMSLFGSSWINLDQLVLDGSSKPQSVKVAPDSLAYIMYTSGSTGMPKGVKISRLALSNFIAGATTLYGVTPDDHILQFANLGFDASIEEIFLAFCAGATLFLRTEHMLSPLELIKFSINHKITLWDLPTAFWRQMISFPEYLDSASDLLLRAVIIGGEAVGVLDAKAWSETNPTHRLFNTYGPTETTVVALAYELKINEVFPLNVPIGRPLPGYVVHVVDENGQQLPDGLVGELVVSGVSIAQGYVNGSMDQNSAFCQIESRIGETTKCYKTGDLVVSDQHGLLYYIGRKDEQIKIRGFRIEPGEIEAQLLQLEGIDDCVVVPFVKKTNEKALAAFFVSTKNWDIQILQLKELLFGLLPNYMVPELMEQIDHIPLTANGKTDKKKLVQQAINLVESKSNLKKLISQQLDDQANVSNSIIHDPKVNKCVTFLLDQVRYLADNQLIMSGDDLTLTGFDSLKFIRLIVAIEREYDIKISISDVYNHTTIEQLAELILHYKPILKSDCITCLREGFLDETPLFIIWGAGQYVFQFDELALHFDERIPLYVLQAPIISGEVEIPESLQELASLYIGEIQRVMPTSRFSLAGYSFGGFVVYEMARQLQKIGNPVDKLFIIDTSSIFVRYVGQSEWIYNTVVKRAQIWWFLTRNPIHQYRIVRKTIADRKIVDEIKLRIQKEEQAAGAPHALEFNDLLHLKAYIMMRTYAIEPSDVKIHLLTTASHLKYGGMTMGWERYATNGVKVFYVDCYHADLFFDQNITILAKWLQRNL